MEIKVLENEKSRLKLEMVGETHSLVNLISKELWKDGDVRVSGYHLRHPQMSNVVLLIETAKKDPKKVLLETLGNIKKRSNEFRTQFKKIVK